MRSSPSRAFRSGREEITTAYERQPPDDEVVIFGAAEDGPEVVARYGWLKDPAREAGRMLLTPQDGKIRKLIVTFEED